ncbi:MAG: hypothetical protein JNM70_15980 [Anaerolineae bacterium]|nr:hypothetical protein [Anaerolineae bacterium]
MADIEVVVAVGSTEGQIQVGVDIDAAGHQVLTFAVDDLVPLRPDILADHHDLLAFDQDIGLNHVAGGDDRAVLEEKSHMPFFLPKHLIHA